MFDKVKLRLNKEHLPAGYDWTSVIDNVNVCNRGYYEGGDGDGVSIEDGKSVQRMIM